MGPGARRATGQHKNVVILVSSHGGMKTDIEEHQPACENITNIDVDLIRQPEAPNSTFLCCLLHGGPRGPFLA